MPSAYTSYNRFTKQATGENTNTWGVILNIVLDLIDFAIAGITTISAAGATTLSTANGATDQARAALINYTGTTAGVLTIPSVSKVYQVRAATAQVTITNGSNSLTIVAGDSATVWTDGTDIRKVQSADFAGRQITNIAAPTSNLHAATKKYVDDTAFASTLLSFPGLTGNRGQPLRVNAAETSVEWAAAAIRLTANYTASPGDRLECDTTGGAFTVTLPATPQPGDVVTVFDGGATITGPGFATNPLTIARNGSTINGLSEDAIARTKGAAVAFEYNNGTWRVRLG